MLQLFAKPGEFAQNLSADLIRRNKAVDATDIDQIRAYLELAVSTSVYATKAKALLTRPLRERGIAVDGSDWRRCGICLYGLWKGMRPDAVERRMAELSERDKDSWRNTFPDDWDIDEQKLIALYRSNEAFQSNTVHDFGDLSLALRYYVTEMLARAAGGRGAFDWGGSEGICCTFLRHHGAPDVTLFELNDHARAFGQWLNGQLGFDDITYTDQRPRRQFGAGLSTEVLEHVVDPPLMVRQMFDMLHPGGVLFVTSSFGVPQDTHLKQNLKWSGREDELMRSAGFVKWNPPVRAPMPFLTTWGFWQRPAA